VECSVTLKVRIFPEEDKLHSEQEEKLEILNEKFNKNISSNLITKKKVEQIFC